MKPVHWGILGPGRIAGKFAEDLQKVEGAQLYAVASRNRERAETFAQEHKASKAFGTYQEMLQDPELDVVYIATPHVYHYENTLLCLSYKKAVLCEKPFAMNRAQVEGMIREARKTKTFLMEALWTQFLPHFRKLQEIIQSGQYGRINSLEADFGFQAPFDTESRLFNKQLGGGSLLDIGIYPVFFALSLLGKPEEITARASIGQTGIDEDCQITFSYPDQVNASLHSTIREKTPTTATIAMEKAILVVNSRFHEPSSIRIITPKTEKLLEFGVTTRGYNYEAAHVQDMLRQDRSESTEMTFEKSLDLIDLLDQVREVIRLEY